jgi:hypothetical protein
MFKCSFFKTACIAAMLGLSVSNVNAQTLTLDLSRSLNPTSFDYTSSGYWTGTYNTDDYTFIDFEHFSFSHLIWGDLLGDGYWDGFTVSRNGDNSVQTDWITCQWGNMAGGGIKTDEAGNVVKDQNGKVQAEQGIPYLLAYWSEFMEMPGMPICQTILTGSDTPYEAVGVYVNATPWAYYSNLNGVAPARPLNQEGDYLKLLIYGLNEDFEDNGLYVEHYFAKFENGVLTQSPDWDYVNLSLLGNVYGFRYTMESTDNSAWGINTPTYFCLDKLQVRNNSTGTKINEMKNNISVYPNPFAEYITIQAATADIVSIYDLSGKEILNIKLQAGSNRINTSALPKGVYVLKQGENTFKIVK